MNMKNSANVVHINTHRITLSEMESETAYPLESFPAPNEERSKEDDDFRAVFWQSYLLSVALAIFCVVLLAAWPI